MVRNIKLMKNYCRKVLIVLVWVTLMLTVLSAFFVAKIAFADEGKIEPRTFVEEMDSEPDTWIPFNDLYLQQMRRSRFNRKDPNYYWLFDQCPCCYPELWGHGWVCPTKEPLPELPPQQNIPEPGVLLLTGTGLLIMYLRKKNART